MSTRQFAIDPTPAAARQLMRLKRLMPETVIDPAIAELALQGVYEDDTGLPPAQVNLVQDLLDYDLRAIVSLNNRIAITRQRELWLLPVIRAAQLRGINDLVLTIPKGGIEAIAREHGMRVHCHREAHTNLDAWSVLDEYSEIPRSAVMIAEATSEGLSRLSRSVMTLSLEFPHTIILADPLSANQTRLFPKMPSLLAAFNKKHVGDRSIRELAFMFNTTYAISAGRID